VSVPGWFRIASVGVMVCLLVAIGALAGFRIASAPVSPPHITQITFSGRVSPSDVQFESLSATATDGSRIYFPQIEKGRAVLAEALIADGETSPLGIPAEIAAPALGDISPDGSKLLLRNHLSTEAEQALWIAPTIGGAARQISGILAHDATWMANGDHILYASGNDLYIAREDGLESRQFATLSGRAFCCAGHPTDRCYASPCSMARPTTLSYGRSTRTGKALIDSLLTGAATEVGAIPRPSVAVAGPRMANISSFRPHGMARAIYGS
jgi:hypothetical protein